MKKIFLLLVLGVATLMSSCSKDKDDNPKGTSEEYYFTAEITLPDGSKTNFNQTDGSLTSYFTIELENVNTYELGAVRAKESKEVFNISMSGKGKGVYNEVLGEKDPKTTKFIDISYTTSEGEKFVATSGEVTITEVSPEICAGTFHFVGNSFNNQKIEVKGKFRCKAGLPNNFNI